MQTNHLLVVLFLHLHIFTGEDFRLTPFMI